MKKNIFALLGAVAIASIPLNASATDNCAIVVNSGETQTINYATSCRVENHGTLNITSGANITKYAQDSYSAIDNYGTLNISGGLIYADQGYAVRNHGGYINMYGGTVNSALHQAIWVTSGSVKVTGGSLKSAGGYEENIYTTGNLTVCGTNYSHNPEAQVNDICKKAATKPAPTQPSSSQNSETITITVISRDKNEGASSTPTTTKPAQSTAKSETSAQNTPATIEEKQEAKTETATKKSAEEKAENESETNLPTAGSEKQNDDNIFAIIIAATIAVLGTASTAILVNRLRA